jgi:hypothetical protein
LNFVSLTSISLQVRYWTILISWAVIQNLPAQFSPSLLQNGSYWTPPKSEFDFYNAELVRDGQKRPCELLMIFTPRVVDRMTLRPLASDKAADGMPVIELNELASAQRGVVVEQLSTWAVWRADTGSLLRLSVAGSDGVGQVMKSFDGLIDPEKHKTTWQHRCDTYAERADLRQFDAPDGTAMFYDELPLRVRTLDFSRVNGQVTVSLLPTTTRASCGPSDYKPATISWKPGPQTLEVDVVHEGGKDHFSLDSDFPFLLRRWEMADGSRLTMKNSLRLDYTQYLKNGDRERALKDPMLRHPD